jgi:transketolase
MTNFQKIKKLKMKIATASAKSKEGHIGSAFSILDILWVLHFNIMGNEDIFILSKGHASLALYAILLESKKITEEEFFSFCEYDSILGGHPDRKKSIFIEASTGSLGHGLPISVGRALARKSKNKLGKIFCLVGDGECNEGTIWESGLLAANHSLNNLICIVDYNNSGDRALSLGDIGKKFESFGWNVINNVDGHNHEELINSFKIFENEKPTIIIAKTIKGKGVSFIENNPAWHHKSPTEEDLNLFYKELQ